MGMTYKCRLDDGFAHMEDSAQKSTCSIPRRDFDRLLSRRQLVKISSATHIAQAMFQHFDINNKLRELGADPADTPMVICNRYANWDYVANTMSACITGTMDGVNSYVATAWFPATIQGHLTIENGNIGEAITISTKDKGLIRATVDAFMSSNAQRSSVLILGTFECVPSQIAGQAVAGRLPPFSGALSLIRFNEASEIINLIINSHQELYDHVAE